MKKRYFLVLLFFLQFILIPAQKMASYDAALADTLGADEYGMRNYVLVILKTGTNDVTDKNLRSEYFKTHFANIRKLSENGKLIFAGPLGKNENQYRGIFIMNVSNLDEINNLLLPDLTIKEKIFEVEMYSLYGSAALPMYLPYHYKIEKTKMQ